MRAVVLRDRTLVLTDVSDPTPGPGELLARTVACGICGSDLHALHHADSLAALGRELGDPYVMDTARDVILGHEICAEVLELGPQTMTGAAPGDLVVSIPIAPMPGGGYHQLGFSNRYGGGYAEQVVLSGWVTSKVPNGLSPTIAALTEPMAVGRHAVERARPSPHDSALVLGCGAVGLAVIADLARRGVSLIVAADFSPTRRKLAEAMGAHVVVDAKTAEPIDAWRKNAAPGQPLVVFEAVGVAGMIDAAMKAAPVGSRIVVVGVCMEDDTIRPALGIVKQLEVSFVLGYTPAEFTDTLRSLAEGEVDVEPLVTGAVRLDGIAGAFEALADPEKHCKILVTP